MFYAVFVLLIARQMGSSKRGAISPFARKFVKPGIFNHEMSMGLHSSLALCFKADYAELAEIAVKTTY